MRKHLRSMTPHRLTPRTGASPGSVASRRFRDSFSIMDTKPQPGARPLEKKAPAPHPFQTIRKVKGLRMLDRKDDAIHLGPTGTRDQTRSPTSL